MQQPEKPPQVSKRYRWFVTLTVILATSAMVIEATIINVAIPSIMRHFAMSQDTAQWLSTGFLGAMAATLLLASWFEEAFGQRRTYMIALTLFVFSSLLGGLADNSALLIVARILQGAIAGLIQPLGMVAIYRVFPESERGRAMSIFGLGVVLAPALGPAVGGYLVDLFSWRAIFFVTVPFCTLSVLLSSRYLPERDASHQSRPFDWFGCLLLTLFLASLLTGFAVGHNQGWLSIGCLVRLVLTLSLGVGFVVLESKLTHPLLNLKLLMNSRFAAATVVAFIYGIGLYGSTYLIPLFVQTVIHYDAGQSGMLLLPGGIALALSISLAGYLMDHFPAHWLMLIGLACFATSFLLLASTGSHASFLAMATWIVIGRIGLGLTIPSLNLGALKAVASEHLSQASGAVNFFRQLGGAIGVNMLSILLDWLSLRGIELGQTTVKAHDAAFSNSFIVLAGVFLLAIYPAWRMRGKTTNIKVEKI